MQFLREELMRPLGSIENQKVIQYYKPNIGRDFKLRQVLTRDSSKHITDSKE